MPYQFATQDKDYSDFSSGRVLYHQPGTPAFPDPSGPQQTPPRRFTPPARDSGLVTFGAPGVHFPLGLYFHRILRSGR